MNAYLLAYSNIVPPVHIHSILNDTTAVATWAQPFPHAAFVLSTLTLSELTAVLGTHLGQVWFVLSEVNAANCNGLLPAEFWEYVTNPTAAWTKKIFSNIKPANDPWAVLAPPSSRPAKGSLLTPPPPMFPPPSDYLTQGSKSNESPKKPNTDIQTWLPPQKK
jgi:hypothetical protein